MDAISSSHSGNFDEKLSHVVMHERYFYRSSSGPVFLLSVLLRSGLFFIGPGPVFGLFDILKNNQKIRNFGGK